MVLSVVRARARAGVAPRRPIRLIFTADEEAGSGLGAALAGREASRGRRGVHRGDRRGRRLLADRPRRPAALSGPDGGEGAGLAEPDRRRAGRARLVPQRRQRGDRAGGGGGPDRDVRVAEPDHRRAAGVPRGGVGGARRRARPRTTSSRRWPSSAASPGWSARPCATRPTRRCCRPATSTTSIPGRATAAIDGRFVPGGQDELLDTITELLGEKVRYEIATENSRGRDRVLRRAGRGDAGLPGRRGPRRAGGAVPDERRDRRQGLDALGIRCFGFAPLRLPPDLDFVSMFHGVDERVPTESLEFGARVLDRFLTRPERAVTLVATMRNVEYEVERVRLARHLSRSAVRQLLTEQASTAAGS